MPEVLYIAAHGGYQEAAPLGGGKAVCDRLVREWEHTRPFPFRLISPSILGQNAPSARDLVRFGERDYAAFCRSFERAATGEVLRHDPERCVVLSNDVSEGPDFAALAGRGYRIATIYHVDVVAYVARIYLRGLVRPRTLVRLAEPLRPLLPEIARLIFVKQRDSLRHSRAVVVPSEGVRGLLLETYPDLPPGRVRVIEWGAILDACDTAAVPLLDLPRDAFVILTLSRLSPEKGIDLLLDALLDWESRPDFPSRPVIAAICGEAAFMQGERYERKLRRMAARLKKVRVKFPGHVTGALREAYFRRADLYVFPSRHESYGLTLMEALAAGLPAVCVDHHGARSIVRPEFGELVRPRELWRPLARLESDPERRRAMGRAGAEYARAHDFSQAADRLAELLLTL